MQITIRPFHAADTEALVEIWRRAVLETHDFLAKADFDDIHEKLGSVYLPAVNVHVACADGRPVGFIGMGGRHVEMLFVDPAVMGSGIGRRLLNHVAGDRPLTVDVNEQNPKAVGFYLRYGILQTGRSETDGQGRPYPLLHLAMPA
ncbi:acetyltransferase [Vulgatibacter incomptus]|uniref:Histone acetyltransferase HPA2 n=1 Tax=Vulgatibacter incomptus TaxID=1391653 RepID=A0A0K1PFS6_9BACT|nr:acetyltransferase [Vulgatibacter incomptus]AKU91969.1 Histone acetyltransferase HPA2 [Vulgatibacter incomptus]